MLGLRILPLDDSILPLASCDKRARSGFSFSVGPVLLGAASHCRFDLAPPQLRGGICILCPVCRSLLGIVDTTCCSRSFCHQYSSNCMAREALCLHRAHRCLGLRLPRGRCPAMVPAAKPRWYMSALATLAVLCRLDAKDFSANSAMHCLLGLLRAAAGAVFLVAATAGFSSVQA